MFISNGIISIEMTIVMAILSKKRLYDNPDHTLNFSYFVKNFAFRSEKSS